MADIKKFYWIKLKTDFFTSKEMKKLRRIAGGDTYTIIYLKLQLLSLQDEGILYYDGIEDSLAEELALVIDEEPENVQATLLFLSKCGLIETKGDKEIMLTAVPELIGKESESAERVRKFREKQRALQSNGEALHCNGESLQSNASVTNCNGAVTKCNTEIEIEKEKEIEIESETELETERDGAQSAPPPARKPTRHRFGQYQNVLLTEEDLGKLQSEFPDDWQKRIESLSAYMKSTGKSYKDHLATIRNWARRDQERGITQGPRTKQTTSKAQELEAFYNQTAAWAEQEDK